MFLPQKNAPFLPSSISCGIRMWYFFQLCLEVSSFFMQVVYLFIYVMQEESFRVVHKHQNYLYDVLAVCVIQFVLTVGRLNSFICKVKYYFMQQVLLYSTSFFFFSPMIQCIDILSCVIVFFVCVCVCVNIRTCTTSGLS